ncbi:tigger transposable element-derived protein 6 [Helicoverpa armigera]|uniref:tigger transposable element-derived protein 6 n=1 Tax=Helicoverpa armigera TaxID=29058 RepID=UPI0030838408
MVRDYKRTTDRGSWSEESMREAVQAVLDGKMGYYKAAKQFNVPQTTLERKVKAARPLLNETSKENLPLSIPIKVPLGPRQPVFSLSEEKELCAYLLEMEERLYGLTVKDVKTLVYQLANKNNKPNPFNDEKKEAGREWINGFLKRHPELSIRKPENTSAARASGFNKVAVEKFFNFLGNVYDEHQLTPDRIYNCDETGVSVVPKTNSKIIAKRGRKQVGAIVSAERGQTVTVEICFSAAGNYMPPMLIFPRKRNNPELMVNSQAGAWGTCSDSGWINSELFLQWFKRFVIFSGASKERPVLLLLDGHSTHTQNIDLINEARAHGVIILCFPPHTTHRLQVADVAFMRPLSVYYEQAVTAWLRSNPGLVVTIRQVAEIFGNAFVQAATMSTAVNGFRKCGIWPYNPNVFSETDFAPSLTTEIQLNESQISTNREVFQDTSNITSVQTSDTVAVQTADNSATFSRDVIDDSLPGCSHWSPRIVYQESAPHQTKDQPNTSQAEQNQSNEQTQSLELAENPVCQEPETSQPAKVPRCGKSDSSFVLTSPKELFPLPLTKKSFRVAKKRGKTAIITSSPYKQELEVIAQKKKEAEQKKIEKIEAKKRKDELKKQKKTTTKAQNKKSKKNNRSAKTAKQRRVSSSEDESEEEGDTPCMYCEEVYSVSIEGWISCSLCGRWAHISCAGIDDDDDEAIHICEFCQVK